MCDMCIVMCRKDDMDFHGHVVRLVGWRKQNVRSLELLLGTEASIMTPNRVDSFSLSFSLRRKEEYLASWREGTSWPPTALWAASFSNNTRLLVLASLRPSTAASSSSAAVRLFQSDRMSTLQTGGHTLSNSVCSSESANSRLFRTVAVSRHT